MQAVGVTTVPARVSAPHRKSRLRNRSAAKVSNPGAAEPGSGSVGGLTGGASTSTTNGSSKHQMTDQDLEGVDRRAICEDILTGGHVQTFVDFFYLTHRPGPAQGELIASGGNAVCVSGRKARKKQPAQPSPHRKSWVVSSFLFCRI